jgi:toxin ParE1/3/4
MLEAGEWYAARSPALAARFVAEIDAVLGRVVQSPFRFPIVLRDIRRTRLQRFPYALFFRVNGETIDVIACFHGKRDPRRWQGRA